MRAGIDRTDRAILIGGGVLLILLVVGSAILTPPERTGGAGFPSSYSAGWDGGKAGYLLLQELGYKVARWEESPTELKGNPAAQVLIIANPTNAPSDEEKQSLKRFLEAGGTMVATGESAREMIPQGARFDEGMAFEPTTTFPALIPSRVTEGAPEIEMPPPRNWSPGGVGQIAVYGKNGTPAVVVQAIGKGQLIWWGSPYPLTNQGLKESGNLALLLNSAGAPGERQVLWDEYFHGSRADLGSYAGRTPLPWVAAQLGLIALFVLVTYSRRSGAIRVPGRTARLSPLEFVDTLGDLYAAGHAGTAAIRVALQRLRFQLTRQLGLPANAPANEIAKVAQRTLGWDEESVRGTLVRAERGARALSSQDGESLEIVQELHDYTSRLETRRSDEEKRNTQ